MRNSTIYRVLANPMVPARGTILLRLREPSKRPGLSPVDCDHDASQGEIKRCL
jgi:hypothetical protein